MPANPLKKALAEQQPKRTAQEWCDYGNAKLAGEIPCTHVGLTNAERKFPMRWVVRGGRPTPELLDMPERNDAAPRRYYWQDTEQT